jgi:plasmid stability protein
MRQITLRGLDPELERAIRSKAKETGKSLNRVVRELVAEGAGLGKGKKGHRGASLAALAGGWTEKDAREFRESVRIFEEIDDEIWK